MAGVNQHATVVLIGGVGVLIRGQSGSGKSLLALRLIDEAGVRGRFAALVADDQVWLECSAGRLVATAPAAIAGLVEIRGVGPVPIRHEPAAIVDCVVTLVAPKDGPRVEEGATTLLFDRVLPELVLGQRGYAAARAVLAWIVRR